MANLVDTIYSFGSFVLDDKYNQDVRELDIKNIKNRMIVSRVEDNIRRIFNKYGRYIKNHIKENSPVYTGQFVNSVSFKVLPPRRLRPNTHINLAFGIDLAKSQRGDLSSYYRSILYGREGSFVSAKHYKLVRWALSKNLIYKDSHGIYRWVQAPVVVVDKRGRKRKVLRKGKKFEGLVINIPRLMDSVYNTQMTALLNSMKNEVVDTVNEVLFRSGLRR